MIQEYILEVKPKTTPLLKKKCKRCDNPRFYCTERFRINSHKKNIDVWLIYRCTKCDNSYNATIISRTNPNDVKKDLFNKFLDNDIETVWKYAFSADLAKINCIEFDFASVQYGIIYQVHSISELLNNENEFIYFNILYSYCFNLRVSAILKETLKLSNNQLAQIFEANIIYIHSKDLQKRDKVKNGLTLKIDLNKLKILLLSWFKGMN